MASIFRCLAKSLQTRLLWLSFVKSEKNTRNILYREASERKIVGSNRILECFFWVFFFGGGGGIRWDEKYHFSLMLLYLLTLNSSAKVYIC